MAEAVASIALETLQDLLIQEVKVLRGVGSQIDDVLVDRQLDPAILSGKIVKMAEAVASVALETLRDLLTEEDARKRQDTDNSETIRNWVRELEDLATQAEIILERKTFGHGVEQYFVGMKKERQLLESLLTNDDHSSNQVISVCGMGGLGKTSLVRKVYQGVQRWFEAHAWICISQQFQRRTILKGLLNQLLPNENVEQHDDDELVRRLYDAQKEKKCLVILDDIWKVEDWNSLRHAFPIGESGSRILLTTRNQNIASTEYVHRLECLSEDEGWELLQKIALPNNYSQG
ncbi:UNVERIFIED_CONTAM: putative disease resistance protein [Sesamum calycinum]|uniref:Disease resistance protein n=1 Tax=Sesamum calycinum TaxID=2727403 RepID=A0AAW2RB01_9LAMI